MKLMRLPFAAGTCLALLGVLSCAKKPGPISVDVSITPSVVESGDLVTFTVRVTNYGGRVTISRIHAREECIAGWAKGLAEAEVDLPLSNDDVAPGATEVVYSQTSPVLNIGPDDLTMEMTVTVYSNGGTDSDICTYKIKKRGAVLGAPPAPELQTLLSGYR